MKRVIFWVLYSITIVELTLLADAAVRSHFKPHVIFVGGTGK